jgi:hypothetical protein
MMNRASSETLFAPTDRSASSSFPTLRGLGCEARVSSSVSGVRQRWQPAAHMKNWRKRRPR